MKGVLCVALIVSVWAIMVMSQTHQPCTTNAHCDNVTCQTSGDVAECHSNECHCHADAECTNASQCVEECGADATCEDNFCHGDCTHH